MENLIPNSHIYPEDMTLSLALVRLYLVIQILTWIRNIRLSDFHNHGQ